MMSWSVQSYLPRKPLKTPLAECGAPIAMLTQSASSMLNRLWALVSGDRGNTQILQELLILRGSTLFPGRE
jgi:hypothetical protein